MSDVMSGEGTWNDDGARQSETELESPDLIENLAGLSSDELDKIGDSLRDHDATNPPAPEKETSIPAEEPKAKPEETPEPKGDEAAKGDDKPLDMATLTAELDRLKKENEELQSHNEQKEGFIQRRNNEIGETRKERDQLRDALTTREQELVRMERQIKDYIEEKGNENPLDTAQAVDDLKTVRQEQVNNQRRMQEIQVDTFIDTQCAKIGVNRESLSQEAVVAMLRQDGVPEREIAAIAQNPKMVGGLNYVNWIQRSRLQSAVVKLITANKGLEAKLSEQQRNSSKTLDAIQNAEFPGVVNGNLPVRRAESQGDTPATSEEFANMPLADLLAMGEQFYK